MQVTARATVAIVLARRGIYNAGIWLIPVNPSEVKTALHITHLVFIENYIYRYTVLYSNFFLSPLWHFSYSLSYQSPLGVDRDVSLLPSVLREMLHLLPGSLITQKQNWKEFFHPKEWQWYPNSLKWLYWDIFCIYHEIQLLFYCSSIF